jgi:hypothetical protein
LEGGVGGGGELAEEGVGVWEGLVCGVFGLRVGVGWWVALRLRVVGVLAVGLLVVDVEACGLFVAVVLFEADESGLEDLGVLLGLTGAVILAFIVLTGDLL